MHEAGLALRIMSCVDERLAGESGGPVRAVRLRIGELAAVNADALAFAFTCLAAGTRYAAARLVVERVPVRTACEDCGDIALVTDLVFRCRRCGSGHTRLLTGRELEVRSVDVDDGAEAPCTTST